MLPCIVIDFFLNKWETAFLDYPDWGFSVLFLSCKANARVKLAKSGHGPHLFRIIVFCVMLVIVLCYCLYAVLLLLCCTLICVALLLFVLSYVLIVCTVPLPPGVNTIAVDKHINIKTNQMRWLSQFYSVIKFYMFWASSLPIIRSFLLYIRHW